MHLLRVCFATQRQSKEEKVVNWTLTQSILEMMINRTTGAELDRSISITVNPRAD